MSERSTLLSLPFIQPAQAQKHVTHNDAVDMLDVLVQLAVTEAPRATPPADATAGNRYIVAPGATGEWAGQDHAVAMFDGPTAGWRFFPPRPGWRAYVVSNATDLVWSGTAWMQAGAPLDSDSPVTLSQLGIGTAPDPTNRLSVVSPATLFSHAGDDHRVKVNKASTSDTASLLFQSNWSGRAEMGLTGSDDFAIKVSPDGDDFITALSFDAATGRARGEAVQTTPQDRTAERLLVTGAFGLGAAAPDVADIGTLPKACGFFSYDTTSTGGPSGVARGMLLQLSHKGVADAQMLIADSGVTYLRTHAATGWQPWRRSGDITATTAQGRYKRSSDGTQMCWQTAVTTTTGDTAVTFPIPFISDTGLVTSCGVISASNTAITARITGRSATGLSVAAFNAAGTRVAVSVDLITCGMWI